MKFGFWSLASQPASVVPLRISQSWLTWISPGSAAATAAAATGGGSIRRRTLPTCHLQSRTGQCRIENANVLYVYCSSTYITVHKKKLNVLIYQGLARSIPTINQLEKPWEKWNLLRTFIPLIPVSSYSRT